MSAASLRCKTALTALAEAVANYCLEFSSLPAFTTNQLRSLLLSLQSGANMPRYIARVQDRAKKKRKTISELLFEDYCKRVGIDCTTINEEGSAKTPDYELVIEDQKIIAEVKEINKNKEERESDRLLEERGYGNVLRGTPGARVRKKITAASAQIKARTADRHPGILVLFDNGQIAGHLDQHHIMTAMYGLVVVDMAVPRDSSVSPYSIGTRLGPNKKMTEDTNTSISAIGTLTVQRPERRIELQIYHNRHAAVSVKPELLTRRGIAQYHLENGKWVEQDSSSTDVTPI